MNDFEDQLVVGRTVMLNTVGIIVYGRIQKVGLLLGIPFIQLSEAERVETLGRYDEALRTGRAQEAEPLFTPEGWCLVGVHTIKMIVPWLDGKKAKK